MEGEICRIVCLSYYESGMDGYVKDGDLIQYP